MIKEKSYKYKNYVIGYDKGFRDKSAFTICEKKEYYLLVIGTLYDKSADILDEWLEHLHLENERLNNIINELNNAYCKVITKCEEMIDSRFYMNDIAIKKYADEIKDICKYYVGEAKEFIIKENK